MGPRLPRRAALAALAVTSATLVGGCFGSFGLTQKVWKFNDGASSNKWIKWLLFLGLIIIPVYSISVFVDAIVLNTIEFFTGKNPMLSRREELGQGHALAFSADGPDAVRVEHFERGQLVRAFRLERQGDTVTLTDHNGRALATARELPSGAVEVRTTRGDVRASLEPAARERVEAAIHAGRTPGEALLG